MHVPSQNAAVPLSARRGGASADAFLQGHGQWGGHGDRRPPYPTDWDEAAELVTGDEARYPAAIDRT